MLGLRIPFQSLLFSGLLMQALRKASLAKKRTVLLRRMSRTLMIPSVSLDTCRRMNPLRPKVTNPNMTAITELRAAESMLPFNTALEDMFARPITPLTSFQVFLTSKFFFLYHSSGKDFNWITAPKRSSKKFVHEVCKCFWVARWEGSQ